MHYLPRVLRYVRPYWKLAIVTVIANVLVALVGLLDPWPLQILFDSVLSSHPLPGPVAPILGSLMDDKVTLTIVVVAAGFGITLLGNSLHVLNSYVETTLSQRMILDFRSDLFQHAQRLSLAYHDSKPTGSLIFTINFQADAAAGLVMALLPLAQSALTLVGMFWITYTIDPALALMSLTVVPFLYWAVGYYVSRIQPRLRAVRDLEGQSLSIVHEAIDMIWVIVAFCREEYEHWRFRKQGREAVDARVGVTVRQTSFSLAVNTTTAAGTALVLGFGVYQILQGRLTAGELLVVLSYVAAIYKPLETITNTVGSLQERFIALELAFGLLDTEPRIRNAPEAGTLDEVRGKIAYRDVDFAYEGRKRTLEGISFTVRPGEVVGIVGPTGAGKSTLVSLLPRFYDPDRGRVFLDGVDVKELQLEFLRKQISIVLQEPLLFSGTIAENILYGRPDAEMEEVVAAARAANAHDFIERLPQGYESRVGEKGVGLSGGERQRISVARAFLKDAPVLILDEPTSSIDSRTEGVILDALDRLMDGRTTFMIAHRLSTIRRPTRVLVLDGGRIVEQGSIAELVELDGVFASLWRAQTGGTATRAGGAGVGEGTGRSGASPGSRPADERPEPVGASAVEGEP